MLKHPTHIIHPTKIIIIRIIRILISKGRGFLKCVWCHTDCGIFQKVLSVNLPSITNTHSDMHLHTLGHL